MKYGDRFLMVVACYLVCVGFLGCATVKEVGKGFAGVSTQVLEKNRQSALKQSFALGYNDCYAKVKELLKPHDLLSLPDQDPYIYAEDLKKKMIAVYLSPTDTTVVGIFFTEELGGNTLIEISSPSIYAKEEMAKRIFIGLDKLIKPKV